MTLSVRLGAHRQIRALTENVSTAAVPTTAINSATPGRSG
jgi:hypothetical protein